MKTPLRYFFQGRLVISVEFQVQTLKKIKVQISQKNSKSNRIMLQGDCASVPSRSPFPKKIKVRTSRSPNLPSSIKLQKIIYV
jgi:hypothetical protein